MTELVISELLWLNYSAPEKPVYVYLNSIGSQGPDGQAVGFETEAYAILDTLAYIRPEIHTLVVGQAYGNAAMILASGKKGSRFSLPNARIMTAPPRMNRSFGSVSNMMIKANELEYNTQSYVDFLSQYTGTLPVTPGLILLCHAVAISTPASAPCALIQVVLLLQSCAASSAMVVSRMSHLPMHALAVRCYNGLCCTGREKEQVRKDVGRNRYFTPPPGHRVWSYRQNSAA